MDKSLVPKVIYVEKFFSMQSKLETNEKKTQTINKSIYSPGFSGKIESSV